jgi:hypothetical protein
MSLPPAVSHSQPVAPRLRRRQSPARWSFTASSGPSEHDHALIVYRLSTANLGIDDLAADIAARCGTMEAVRWQRARAREYVIRLRDQLRLHVSNAELFVHADEADSDDRLQVIATMSCGDATQPARLEQDITDHVQAISKRTWINWSEGLRLTMATLNDLENPPA